MKIRCQLSLVAVVTLLACSQHPDAPASKGQTTAPNAPASKPQTALIPSDIPKAAPAPALKRDIGPGDLKLGMSWLDAEKTPFVQNSRVLAQVKESTKTFPFGDLQSGELCITVAFGTQIHSCDTREYTVAPLKYEEHVKLPKFVVPFYAQVFGEDRRIEVTVVNGVVSDISVEFGGYLQAKSDEVLKTLRDTYGNFVSPSETELADFNARRSTCAAWVSETGLVAWRVVRFNLVQTHVVYGQNSIPNECLPVALRSPKGSKL